MKKQHLLLIALCLYAFWEMQAQEYRPRRIEIGLIAGPTIDWAVSNTRSYSSSGVKLGGVYGLNVDINLVPTSSNYFFSTGINARHIRFGLEYRDNYLYDNPDNNYQTDILYNSLVKSTFNTVYVTIPTAIKLKTNSFGDFVFGGIIGLEHGIAVSSKSNDEIKHDIAGTKKQDKVNHYKNTSIFKESLYIVFCTEYHIQDKTKVTFGLGYDYGLNNVFRRKYKNSLTQELVKANVHRIELQFGVTF